MTSARSWRTLWRWARRVWIAGGLGFVLWLIWNVQAHGVPDALLSSDSRVRLERLPHAHVFEPSSPTGKPAMIFLPGGGIDPTAYVPVMHALADAGHPSALVWLPYRLAPSERSRQELWRRITVLADRWRGERPVVLGGHSRGAALAARFAAAHEISLDGLVLIGTTHPRDHDLSGATIPVTKIVGSRDCVASPAAARANAAHLPADTIWVEIAGANHAQFGYYGSQLMDCAATIDRDAQQRALHAAIRTFLDGL